MIAKFKVIPDGTDGGDAEQMAIVDREAMQYNTLLEGFRMPFALQRSSKV